MPENPVRVLVVDDSAVVRQSLSRILNADAQIEVIATAPDPYVARQRLEKDVPDVITLDLEMPRMDGLSFLKILMEQYPLPVVVVSSLAQEGSQKALDAVQYGAVDVIPKPGGSFSVNQLGPQLIQKVKAAARARIEGRKSGSQPVALKFPAETGARPSIPAGTSATASTLSGNGNCAVATKPTRRLLHTQPIDPIPLERVSKGQFILLGASTGGTEALREVLMRFPPNSPPIFVVQHIPAYFSKAFADRLNGLCHLTVQEATDGDVVGPGHCRIAPGDYHMTLERATPGSFRTCLNQGPMVWHQRPAVDVLFRSAAGFANRSTTAAVLTGMGRDGAEGLLALRERGVSTFAEAEESCVVYGMPKACHDIGAAREMVPLPNMAAAILNAVGTGA